MSEVAENEPTFNLWHEPWITLEDSVGTTQRFGIEETLLGAHQYAVIHEPSPLVVVGIHRLLIAILQAAFNPSRPPDLLKLWRCGRLPQDPVIAFGQRYLRRVLKNQVMDRID